jgi:hypothetical protein
MTMRITCANFQTSVALSTATRDQILMAVTADACVTDGSSCVELPEVAILWFFDNLIRSISNAWSEQSGTNSFMDFYGEYKVTVRPSRGGAVGVEIETGGSAFACSLDVHGLPDDLTSFLSLAERNLDEASRSIAFRQTKQELLSIAQRVASPPTPDS